MGQRQYTDGIALFYARVFRDEAARRGLQLSEAGNKRAAREQLKEAGRWDKEVKRIETALGRRTSPSKAARD